MANPVTYNSSVYLAGALKNSVISIGVDPNLSVTGYNWRNGFENNNIWVIYSDTYSQGQSTAGNSVPTIWATPIFTEAGLINLINVLPARAGQTAFTTLSSAISWLYGENKYFLSNQNYPMIATTNLLGVWDFGMSGSYPNVGTTVYNLGNTDNGTLVNGPIWVDSNTKSYFDLDGSDDYISVSSLNLQQNFTLEAWVYMDNTNGFCFFGQGGQNTNQGLHIWMITSGTVLRFGMYSNDYDIVWTPNSGKWYQVGFTYNNSTYEKKVYINGYDYAGSNVSGPGPYQGSGQFNIGAIYSSPTAYANGRFSKSLFYNKVLSASEIEQNYYQGPIVTSSLTYLWDASNLVSFASGASTTFDLKGTGINGTLQNGVGYSSNFGGYWSFDGTDDRILLNTSITLGNGDQNWTVNAWIRTTSTSDGLSVNPILSNTNGGPIYSSLDINSGYQAYWAYPSNIGGWKQFLGSVYVADNQWHMLTWVNNSNYTMDFYVDGIFDKTVSPVNVANNNPLDVIGGGLGYPLNGQIGSVQVNKGLAMNSAQVSQQFGATRRRFDCYQAYANGGTISTLSQSGVTYRVHTFTTSGTLSVTKGGDVEVLMIAGGGGGGSAANSFWETGGGGGAGGLISNTGIPVTDGTNYTVTVGAGGAGGLNQTNASPSNRSGNGSNTTFSTLTAVGGGGGGGAYYGSEIGGSGGGADSYLYQPGSAGTQFQGYGGGSGNGQSSNLLGAAGGGGGAGGPGQNGQGGSPYKGGDGGIGRAFTFSGNTAVFYAGGGGGKTAINGSGPGGAGGSGGGGNGGAAGGSVIGDNGGANTGGGGGGGLSTSTPTGSGGSGVVMIRYIVT